LCCGESVCGFAVDFGEFLRVEKAEIAVGSLGNLIKEMLGMFLDGAKI
jgi:hypothetical protein